MSRGLRAAALSGLLVAGACHQSQQPTSASAPPRVPEADRRLLAELPSTYAQADLDNGALHFNLCKPCHTITDGGPNMTGPNLHGLFGRKVANKSGFVYSDALKAKGWTWDAAQLDSWLKNPRAYVPGTKMTFYGIPDNEDRRDLIAYLKVASSSSQP